MKLYNRDLEQINNSSREKRFLILVTEVINFLNNEYGIDRDFLHKKANEIAFVEREPSESSFVEYNGKKEEVRSEGAASFVTHKKQEYDGQKWNFENAIYTSDTNSEHTIKHEIFHYFSAVLSVEFNEKGIGYDKSGIELTGYDKSDRVVDSSVKASGLNEGITELLAQKLDNAKTLENSYAYQVSIADILINSKDKSLIKAYFSKDENSFKSFLQEFEKRQNTISSDELVRITPNESFDNLNRDLLKGCIEYSLSFCKTKEDFNIEKNRLLPIIDNIEIAYYQDGKNVKEYLLNAISEIEKNIEEIELSSSNGIIINEFDEILRDDNSQNNKEIPEMVTLPTGIKIPKKQYEEEYLKEKQKDNLQNSEVTPEMVTLSNGVKIPKKQYEEEYLEEKYEDTESSKHRKGERIQAQEQVIGKSQAQVERKEKDNETRKRIEKQASKMKGPAIKRDVFNSIVYESEYQESLITIEERRERSKLITKEKLKTITPEEKIRLEELNKKKKNDIEKNNQNKNDLKKSNGMVR